MDSLKLTLIASLCLLPLQDCLAASDLRTIKENVQTSAATLETQSMMKTKWFGNDVNIALPTASTAIPPASIPMQQFPREEASLSQAPRRPHADQIAGPLVLTTRYFSDEINPRAALQEACAEQAAHFNEPAYYYRKAALLIQLGSYSRANQELKGLLVDIPNNSDYHIAKAYCLYKLGQKTAALDEVGMARFHNPRLPEIVEFAD
jgi:tetratricopeptide (TPR) repeat protein